MQELSTLTTNLKPLLARLIHNFLNADYEQRRESAIALSKFKGEKATDFLLETYESDNIQDFMALALGNIDSSKAISLLVSALNDSQQEVRFNAAQALGMMENQEAFNILMEALNDYTDSSIVSPESEDAQAPTAQIFFEEEAIISAIIALGKIQNRLSISLLKRLLAQEKSPRIRASIIMSLGMMPSDRLLPVFQGALRDEDPRVRANAIEAIESLKSGSIVGIIQPYLEDPSNRVRANVAKAIWKYGDFDVSETLKQMIQHQDKWYRASAAYAIGEIKDSRFIRELAKALKDEDPDVRRNATNALRKIEYKEALPHLKPLLNDPNFDVRVEAALAIARCAPDKAVELLSAKLQEEENFIVQATLISSLGSTGQKGVLDLIMPFLESEDPRVVSNSIEAISELSGGPNSGLIERFRELLAHEDNRVKSTAIKRLWVWGDYEVLADLRNLFNSSNEGYVKSATFVLGEIGDELSKNENSRAISNKLVAELVDNPEEMKAAIQSSYVGTESSAPAKVIASEPETTTNESQGEPAPTAESPSAAPDQTEEKEQLVKPSHPQPSIEENKTEEPVSQPVKPDHSFEDELKYANDAIMAKELSTAEKTFKEILEKKPDHLKAIMGIANLYFLQKQFGSAAEYYQEALEINPNLVKAHYNLGTIFFYAKKNEGAVSHLLKALSLYPKILGAYLILGQIYQNAGKASESIKLLTKAIELSPRNPVIYQKLAVLHIQLKEFDQAVEVLTKAIDLSPLDVESNLLLSYCFHFTGQPAKAFSAMDLTLKACTQSPHPENSLKQMLKGYLYIKSTIQE